MELIRRSRADICYEKSCYSQMVRNSLTDFRKNKFPTAQSSKCLLKVSQSDKSWDKQNIMDCVRTEAVIRYIAR